MSEKADILNIEDVKNLVDTFYGKVRSDLLLAPIFNERIRDNWPVHLEKMYRFWQTVLLNEHTYPGSPFPPHASLPIDHGHFQAWLGLFRETVDELFTGEKAKEPNGGQIKWQRCLNPEYNISRNRDLKAYFKTDQPGGQRFPLQMLFQTGIPYCIYDPAAFLPTL